MRPGLLAAAIRDIVGRHGLGTPATASDHDAPNADPLAFINGHHPQPGLPHHARI
jgi:hypothetical protein